MTLAAVLVLTCGVLATLSPYFLTVGNIFGVLQQVSITSVIAFGAAIVIISRGIDLSVGSVAALSGIPAAFVLLSGDGGPISILLAILVGVGIGTAAGIANGVGIVYFRIPAFIATLAMLSIARGLALSITGARPVFGLPSEFTFIGSGFLGPVPVSVLIMMGVFAIAMWVMEVTPFGRTVYAIGGNEEAARLTGVSVSRYRVIIYSISGACAGLGGVMLTALLASAQPEGGEALLFDSVTAAIVGGVALFGGKGSMLGVLIGAIFIGVVRNGQGLLNVNPYMQLVISGAIVLVVIAISSLRERS
ncbi:MAG: ABC transporter permease [Candidatus Limnocylindria bacterium]